MKCLTSLVSKYPNVNRVPIQKHAKDLGDDISEFITRKPALPAKVFTLPRKCATFEVTPKKKSLFTNFPKFTR